MALTSFASGGMARIRTTPVTGLATAPTLDAVGESYFTLGYLVWEDGASHDVSPSTGVIYWRPSTTLTWADAGTNLRVGIQDIDGTTGLEDATFDVYADLVPGTDSLTVNTLATATMDGGATKTIANLQQVALGFEMTARGGTDSVRPSICPTNGHEYFPYSTQDTGSGPAKITSGGYLMATVKSDDGKYGWILGGGYALHTIANISSYHLDSTPDERGLKWSAPWAVKYAGFIPVINSVGAGDNFEVDLYTDPVGTPGLIEAITKDPDLIAGTSNAAFLAALAAQYSGLASTAYGVTIRPTVSGQAVGFAYNDFTGNTDLRKALPFGTDCSAISRTGNSGAFTEDTALVPCIDILVPAFHDGAGGSGGGPLTRSRLVGI